MDERFKYWGDIGFTARMTREGGTASVHFKGYEVAGYSTNETPLYHVAGYTSGMEVTGSLDEAQIYLSGSIKWDGYSNINFDEQENTVLHFGSKRGAEKIGTLLGRLYDLAAEMMPEHAEFLR